MVILPDSSRRRFLGTLAVLPFFGVEPGSARTRRMESGGTPAWAPPSGHAVSISYLAGKHPLGRGATCAEISPAFQSWNPHAPSIALYGNGYGWNSVYGYCGSSFNTDTRQIVMYGAGHSSINVCAPYCFDLNDLRWKWLDVPLPFDALIKAAANPHGNAAYYMNFYPPEQLVFEWGELQGDWSGWPAGYGRPGKIFPLTNHTQATLINIPAANYGNSKGALLFSGGITGVLTGTEMSVSHVFDYDTQSWSRTTNKYSKVGMGSRGIVFDRVTGQAATFGNGGNPSTTWRVFDATTRTWTNRTASAAAFFETYGGSHVFHEASRLYICPAHVDVSGTGNYGTTKIRYRFFATPFDAIVGTGSFAPTELNVNAVSTWPLTSLGSNQYLGWSYCPEDRCLYIINGEHGSNKYWRFAPPVGATTQNEYLTGTWMLTEHTFLSGTLQSPGQYTPRSTMYNRMQWDAVSRSFVWWPDSINGPVQAWRPAMV